MRTPNHHEADVLIEDDRIVEIGTSLRSRNAEVVDASKAIVMPGFVDTHRHAWQALTRSLGDQAGEPVATGLHGPHHRPDDIYAGTLAALLGAVEAGVTAVVDWADIPTGYEHVEAALQAHTDAGVRGVFVHAVPSWPGAEDLPSLLARRSLDSTGVTTFAAGSPDIAEHSLEAAAEAFSAARERGLRIHAHAGLDPGGRGAVAELDRRALLAPDVTLIHCSDLDGTDLDAIASAGAAVSLTPSSEMAGGFGAPPIRELIDRGIRPGLGVDNERVAPGDIFAQMRALIALHHGVHFELRLAGKAGLSNLMDTRDAIRHATLDGARAAGLDATTGSLEPGKQADIVVLRTDRPNIFPVNDPIGAVVWGMDTSNIDWVFVAGRPVVQDGVVQADTARARKLASEAQERVAERAGGLPTETAAGVEL